MKDIGVRIRERRARLGWTVLKLATLAGIDGGFLSKLETGKASGSWETYIKIAGALGVSVDALLVTQSNVEDAPKDWRRIPVLDYRQAGKWTSSHQLGDMLQRETILANLEHPPSTFALRLRDDSMETRFKVDDVVVIDPTIVPRAGDFVVVSNPGGEASFRQYRLAGINEKGIEVFEVWPLNAIYAPLRSDRSQLAIVGTMVEHRSYRKR